MQVAEESIAAELLLGETEQASLAAPQVDLFCFSALLLLSCALAGFDLASERDIILLASWASDLLFNS
jgi:hypothetical protein